MGGSHLPKNQAMNTGLETVAAYVWLRRNILNNVAFQDIMTTEDPANADPAVLDRRVHRPPFPGKSPETVVALTVVSAVDFKTLGGEGALFSDVVFALQVMTVEEIPAKAAAIYGAIHPILEEMFGTDNSASSFGVVIECEREGGIDNFSRDEDDYGQCVLGGVYRLKAQSRGAFEEGSTGEPVGENGSETVII